MANYTQDGWGAVGGKLFVTDRRVIFLPNVLDDMLGCSSIDLSLESIAELFVKERSVSLGNPFSGGGGDRLAICRNDGQETLFAVWQLLKTMRAIEAALVN